MPNRDIIVIGASAGGVEALICLARGLPPELPAAVFITLHVMPRGYSVMPELLKRAGRLPAMHAADLTPIRNGRILIAPPDRHLLVREGFVQLGRGAPERRHRPSIDAMFRSAASAYGPRAIGVVLTGSLDDGTEGLRAIKDAGGLTVVQDPADARYPGMPRSALDRVEVDRVIALTGLAELLIRLASEPVETEPAPEEIALARGSSRLGRPLPQRNRDAGTKT